MKSPKNKTSSKNNNLSDTPCDGCRSLHRRCNRNLTQCSNCQKRGICCSYTVAPKRRGPKTKVDSMLEYCESMNSSLLSKQASSIENKPIVKSCETSSRYPVQSLPLTQHPVNPMLYPSAINHPIVPSTIMNYQYHLPYYYNYQASWFPSTPYIPFEMANRLLYIDLNLTNQSTNNNSNNTSTNNNSNSNNNN